MGEFLFEHNFDMIGKKGIQSANFINWENFDKKTPQSLLIEYGSGFAKTLNLIYKARAANAFILALVIISAYFIVLFTFGDLAAILTVFFYATNNILITNSLVAHSEPLFLLFFNLSI